MSVEKSKSDSIYVVSSMDVQRVKKNECVSNTKYTRIFHDQDFFQKI